MKTYQKYKNSGIRWLGSMPSHWELKKLKWTANYCVSNVDKVPAENEDPVKLCNYTDVYYYDFISPNMELMETTATKEEIQRFHLKKDDVVITKDSEEWDDIAISALVTETSPNLVCGYHLAIIRSNKKELIGKYLHRLMQAVEINRQFQVAATGVTRYGLPKDAIGQALILLPPLPEQLSIAAFLDRETSRIDGLIARKKRQIELLQKKRTALISQAVTKGLDPKVKMNDSGVAWLGKVPSHWEISKIKFSGRIKYGLGEPPSQKDDGLLFVRATDIDAGKILLDSITKVDPDDIPWSRDPGLKEDDILVVRSGAYTGDSAIVPKELEGSIAGYDMVLRVNKAIPEFVAYALLSKYILDAQIMLERMRAAQPHLNAEDLGSMILLIPPIEEQSLIVNHLNRECRKNAELISIIQKSINSLGNYRTALISAAVTGKIDVREEAAA
jgi:type I restriction enzyme S subunit